MAMPPELKRTHTSKESPDMEHLLSGVRAISMSTTRSTTEVYGNNKQALHLKKSSTSSISQESCYNYLIDPSSSHIYSSQDEKRITEDVSKAFLNKWWGRLLPTFGSQFPEYSNQLESWFSMSDSDLWRVLSQDCIRLSAVERCPHISITLSNIQVFKLSKKTHKYNLKIFLSSDPEYVLTIDTSGEGHHSQTHKFHLDNPLDVDSTYLEILLEKEGTFDKGLKGRARVNLSFVSGDVPLIWSDKETGRLCLEIKRKNLDVTPARETIPRLLSNHLKEVLIDDAVFDNLKGFLELPKYFMEFSEVRVGEVTSGLETRLYLNNVLIQDEVDDKYSQKNISSTLRLQFPFLNLMKDSLRLCLYSRNKKSNVFSQEQRVIDWVSPVGKCSEVYSEHINRTTYQWSMRIFEESVRNDDDQQMSALGESLFFYLYHNRLENLIDERDYTEDHSILLEWEGSFEDKYENLLKVLNVFDPQNQSWALEKSKALLKVHSKYRFNNFVLSSLLSGIDTSPLMDYEYRDLYMDYALHHLCYYVTDGNYNKLSLAQLKSLLGNILTLNEENEDSVLDMMRPIMISSIERHHDLSNLNNHKIILEQSILPSIRGTPRLFDSFGAKWVVELAILYLDLSLPILRNVINDCSADCTNGLLTFNIFVQSRTVASAVGQREKEYMDLIYSIFRGCHDSWVDSTLAEASKQVSRVLQLERNKHKKSSAKASNGRKSSNRRVSSDLEEDEYESPLDGALDIEGIFDTCRYVWSEIQWPFPSENIRFGSRLLSGLHQIYNGYIKDFGDILRNSDDDPSMSTDELITIVNSSHRSVSYLSKFHSAINAHIDAETRREDKCIDEALSAQIIDYLEILTEASREIDSRNEDLIQTFCLSQKPILAEYIRKQGIVGDGSNEDSSSLHYINSALQTLHLKLDTGAKATDEKLHKELKKQLMALHDNLVCEYYKSVKNEYDRKGRNPQVFQNISDGIPHMIGFRRTLSMEDNPDILNLKNELYPQCYSSEVLVHQHLKHIHESEEIGLLTSEKVMGVVRLEMKAEEVGGRRFIKVNLKSIREVVPPEGKQSSNFSISLALAPSLTNQRDCTGIYADSENVLFDLMGEHESACHDFSFEISPSDPSEMFLTVELFEHSRTLQKKVFQGIAFVPLSSEEESMICQELELRCLTQEALNSLEFLELLKRKDAVAKEHLYRMRKYVYKKSIHLNLFRHKQEWIRV